MDCCTMPDVRELVGMLRRGKVDRVDMERCADAMEDMLQQMQDAQAEITVCADCRKLKHCNLREAEPGLTFCSAGEPKKKPHWPLKLCPFNEGVQCDGGWCGSCGWRKK